MNTRNSLVVARVGECCGVSVRVVVRMDGSK